MSAVSHSPNATTTPVITHNNTLTTIYCHFLTGSNTGWKHYHLAVTGDKNQAQCTHNNTDTGGGGGGGGGSRLAWWFYSLPVRYGPQILFRPHAKRVGNYIKWILQWCQMGSFKVWQASNSNATEINMCYVDCNVLSRFDKSPLGLYSLSGKTSYRKISWSLEAARFGFKLFQSLWNLTGTSAALLPRCLSNFRTIRPLQHPISRLRDFTLFGGKTSYRLVNRGPVPSTHLKLTRVVYPFLWCIPLSIP